MTGWTPRRHHEPRSQNGCFRTTVTPRRLKITKRQTHLLLLAKRRTPWSRSYKPSAAAITRALKRTGERLRLVTGRWKHSFPSSAFAALPSNDLEKVYMHSQIARETIFETYFCPRGHWRALGQDMDCEQRTDELDAQLEDVQLCCLQGFY